MKKILVVDDNKDILTVLEIFLEMRGHIISTEWNGEQVIQKVNDFGPDLVLLDVLLGTVSGIRICNELKANPKTRDICVVMFSAHAKADDILKLCAADGFLAKPFDIHQLQEIIEGHLANC